MAVRKTAKQPKREAKKSRPPRSKKPSVWEEIIERARRVPSGEDKLPTDLATRADDYLEGRAKL